MKASILALLGCVAGAFAFPTPQINANGTLAANGGGPSDLEILQFALALELLEINLYETVVTTYSSQDFVNAGFAAADRDTFNQIITEELAHIGAIRRNIIMLGGTPAGPCKYDYGTVTSLNQLLNNTDAVNGLGPSAYLGAGAFINSKLILTEGASIGNIETRHNSWLNGLIGRSEVPTAFQLSLSFNQAYGVASQFIVSGSCSPPKAVTAMPPMLTITNPGYPAAPLQAGGKIYLKPAKSVGAKKVAFIYGFNTTVVSLNSDGSATIPYDTAGQAYAVLTTASQGDVLTDANSLTTPAAFFVDAPAQNYANLVYSTYQFSP